MVKHLTIVANAGRIERAPVRDFFQQTLDSLLSIVAVLRSDGTIVAVNAAWNAFATENGLVENRCGPGVNYLRVCESATGSCSEQAPLIANAIRDVAQNQIPDFQIEYPCHSPTEQRWFVARVTRFTVDSQCFIVVTHDDITQRKLAELEVREASRLLKAQATTDGLTGLANRRYFDQILAQEWKRHARFRSTLSLLLVDVDHFKQYNDTHGHLRGDDCLREVAQLLRSAISRPGDLVARFGGEEFAAILPETDRVGALAVAWNVQNELRKRKFPNPKSSAGPFLRVSIGSASVLPTVNVAETDLIKQADSALYEAKAAGRDRAIHSGG
jgi:diguanylate cyclase (GGDEF)-like protein